MAITFVPPISLNNGRLPPVEPEKQKKIKKLAAKKPLGVPKPVTAPTPEPAEIIVDAPPIEPLITEPIVEVATPEPQTSEMTSIETGLVPTAMKPPKRRRGQRFATFFTRIKSPFIKFNRGIQAVPFNVWLLPIYMILIGGTQLALIGYPNVGLYLNVASLVVMIIVALWREDARKLSISLAILPVTQMVSSTIKSKNAFITACIFYGLILVLAILYRYLFTLNEPVAETQLKTRGHAFGIPLMLVLGEVVGLIGYGFLRHHYPYMHISLPLVASASVIFAFAEEMFLRGLIQQQASHIVNPLLAAALTSVIYVFLAIGSMTPLTIAPALALGVVLAAVYHFKRNLLLSTTINAAAKLTYVGLVATFVLR